MRPRTAAIALAVVLAAAAAFFWWQDSAEQSVTGEIARVEADGAATGEPPPIRNPLEPAPLAPQAPPLPTLEDSDGFLGERVGSLWLDERLPTGWFADRLARRIVATVDALPRETLPLEIRALRPVAGALVIEGAEEEPVLGAGNAARYDTYLQLLDAMDTARAVALYRELYPLLQQAYEELGYPGRYFNDRAVAVIDHLLETPVPDGPLRLARPHVLYTYAEADLESRSAGQKILLRMGPERAERVKAKLREFRAEIASGAPAGPRAPAQDPADAADAAGVDGGAAPPA